MNANITDMDTNTEIWKVFSISEDKIGHSLIFPLQSLYDIKLVLNK